MSSTLYLGSLLFIYCFLQPVFPFKDFFPPSNTFLGEYQVSTSVRLNSPQDVKAANLLCQLGVSRYADSPDIIRVTAHTCKCGNIVHCLDEEIGSHGTFYIRLSEDLGHIDRLHIHREVSSMFVKNLFKGFASLLQVASIEWNDSPNDSTLPLEDSSGECTLKLVSASTKEENCTLVDKLNCRAFHLGQERSSSMEVLDVAHKHRASYRTCHGGPSGQWINITSQDSHTLFPTLYSHLGQTIEAKQNLRIMDWVPFQETFTDEQSLMLTTEFVESSLVTYSERELHLEEESVRTQLDSVRAHLRVEKLASLDQVSTLQLLLHQMRLVRNEHILVDVLRDDEYLDIQAQLVDLYAACGTLSCVHALLNFSMSEASVEEHHMISTDLMERVLVALSHVTPVTRDILLFFLEKMENGDKVFRHESVFHQALITLGAMVNNHLTGLPSAKYSADPIIARVEKFFYSSYEKCTSEECKMAVIGAMESADQMPHNFLTLMNLMMDKVTTRHATLPLSVQVSIMKALKSMRLPSVPEHVDKLESFLRRILLHPRQPLDLCIVSSAVDLTMRLQERPNLLMEVFTQLLTNSNWHSLLGMKHDRVRLWCERQLLPEYLCHQALAKINRGFHAVKPVSQTLSGTFVNNSEVISEFTLEMVGLASGLQKSSVMEVAVVGPENEMKLFSIHLYSSGLESLLGGGEEEGNAEPVDDSSITAGLLLNLIKTPLRPVQFFHGQSGLLSAVWNAPSELTPVVQANLRLHDFQVSLHLQNGFVVDFACHGLLGLDLSGSVSASLWTRKADSLIRTSAAFVLETSSSFHNQHMPWYSSSRVASESHVDFSTQIDVSKTPVEVCMSMETPAVEVIHTVQSAATQQRFQISDNKRKLVSRVTKFPGQSYSLGGRNDQFCRIMQSA